MRNFFNEKLQTIQIPGTTIIRSKDQALYAINQLKKHPDRVVGWDTETIDIDPKIESPVNKGKIICATAFCGPDVNFGSGSRLFIDNYA
jgi:DNA polymerase I